MLFSNQGKNWVQTILPSSRVFVGLYALLIVVFSVLILLNHDLGTLWAILMAPIFLAALAYSRRIYFITLGMYVVVSFAIITSASIDKIISLQETITFLAAVAFVGEVLSRLTQARKGAEDALRDREQRFRSLSATAPVGIFETDAQGNPVYANARFRAILGLTREAGIEIEDLKRLLSTSDAFVNEDVWREAIASGKDFHRELRVLVHDEEERWVDVRATPTLMPDGSVRNYVGTVEDITERKQSAEALQRANNELEERVRQRTDQLSTAIEKLEQEIQERKQTEEALRQADERFSKAFNASPAAISINSLSDGRFISVNESFLRMIGYEENEVVGHKGDALGFTETDKEQERIEELLRRKGAVHNVEMTFLTKRGESHVALLSLEPIEIAGEQCVLTIGTDITERKSMEKQVEEYASSLNHLLNQLMNAQEAERRRLAMDIHDGPLQSLGVSLLALDRAIRRLEREEYDVVDREMRYLRTTLASTVGEVRAVLADLSLEVLMTYGLEFALRGHIERLADVTGLAIRFSDELTHRPSPEVELLMYRLAQEALANVRKHSHAQNTSVSLFEQGDNLHMIISDDGRGFRVRAALQQHEDGDRLGLRSMLQRVQAMGGDLTITSAPGEGTTLEFWCPIGTRHPSGLLTTPGQQLKG